MTSLYDRNWPVNFAEQKSLAKQILTRTQDVLNRTQQVFLSQLYQPTEPEWATAYVAQTGQPLPIPVGTRLVWYSLISGECETFITTNDGANGLSSTGAAYQLLDDNWDRPSIRLLGYSSSNIVGPGLVAYPAYASRNNVNVGLNRNELYRWSDKGLDSLLFIYKLRNNVVTGGAVRVLFNITDVGFGGGIIGWAEDRTFGATNYMLSSYLEITLAAATVGVGDGTSNAGIGNQAASTGSLANAYSQGIVMVQNHVQRTRIDTGVVVPVDDDVAPTALHMGSWIGTGLTTSQVAVEVGAAQKIDEYHTNLSFGNITLSNSSVIGELWLYGIFKSLTRKL